MIKTQITEKKNPIVTLINLNHDSQLKSNLPNALKTIAEYIEGIIRTDKKCPSNFSFILGMFGG